MYRDARVGVNEDNLSDLSFEIEDYADRLSEIFGKMDACIEKISLNYKDDSCKELVNYYNGLKKSFPILKANILSYSTDFISLIKKMHENDQYLASLFKDSIEELKMLEQINNEEGK